MAREKADFHELYCVIDVERKYVAESAQFTATKLPYLRVKELEYKLRVWFNTPDGEVLLSYILGHDYEITIPLIFKSLSVEFGDIVPLEVIGEE